ncbi:zinc finger, CCHC-type containing protein [Tanacetum coccineum]
MASMNTRLNIEKLDENIVQKHGGSKQVGFKQLGPGVEIRVYGVHDENHVWFEVKLQGAQGDRKVEVFQVSNDDTAVTQRRLEDKQPEEKTNTDCLSGVTKHLGVAVIQQQNELVKETNVTLLAKVHYFLIQSGLSKVLWAEDTTMYTYLVNRSPSSAIGFKTPVDMLGFFGWLASIKQGMLEPVKVKCILLGYRKGIVGNKLWRLDDVTSKVVLYRNMGFNESGEYKKTFIGSGVVAVVDKVYAHESLTFNYTVACEVISKWKARLKDDIHARSDVYVLSNGCRRCSDESDGYYWEYTPDMFIYLFLYIDDMIFSCGCKAEIWATKGLLDKAIEKVLGMEIVRDQSGNTLRVSQSKFYNGKLVQTLLEGHSILSLEGSLSGDCDVEKNGKWSCIYAVGNQEYQVVCTRLDIASADVAMMLYMMALSPTKAGVYDTYEGCKEAIGLKGLAIESGFELKIVAGIAIGALSKAIPGPRFQHRLKLLRIEDF